MTATTVNPTKNNMTVANKQTVTPNHWQTFVYWNAPVLNKIQPNYVMTTTAVKVQS